MNDRGKVTFHLKARILSVFPMLLKLMICLPSLPNSEVETFHVKVYKQSKQNLHKSS